MNETLSYRKASQRLNDITYTDFYHRLNLMARSMFEWKNLPNGIRGEWIEKYLFYEGQCMFFKNEKLGLMVARTVTTNHVNEYDEPTALMPVFHNNHIIDTKHYKNETECVLIKNNDMRLPTERTIRLFALRLTDVQRTIDVNIKAQKTPLIVKCSNNQLKSYRKAMGQYNDNELFLWADNDFETNNIDSFRVDAPVVFDKLQLHKHAVWNECMTFLGINNANMDKRERLVDDEVQANNEQIQMSAQIMLKQRELACERINALFSTNISVELKTPQTPILEELEGVNNV